MKRNLLLQLTTGLMLCATGSAFSQLLISGNAYMKGEYVEVAIDHTGKEGTEEIAADTVYHFDGRGGMGDHAWGFVANPQMNDWETFNGDFFTPGTPECGFGITYTVAGTEYSHGNNFNITEILGEIVDYTETVDSVSVTWEGMVDSLQMTLLYELKKDELLYSTTVSLVNLGSLTFSDVYFYDTVDPDNNQSIGGGFGTENTIMLQSNPSDDSVKVLASQTMPHLSELYLLAKGTAWKGYKGGFLNRNGSDMWNGNAGLDTTQGPGSFADQAIGLVHKTDLIGPGKAGGTVFSYGTAFAGNARPHADDDLGINDANKLDFKVYPNPTDGNLVNLKVDGAFTFEILNINGQLIQAGTSYGTTQLSLSGVDKGLYFIRIRQDESTATKKLIIK